jgi:hypothetical protein
MTWWDCLASCLAWLRPSASFEIKSAHIGHVRPRIDRGLRGLSGGPRIASDGFHSKYGVECAANGAAAALGSLDC